MMFVLLTRAASEYGNQMALYSGFGPKCRSQGQKLEVNSLIKIFMGKFWMNYQTNAEKFNFNSRHD